MIEGILQNFGVVAERPQNRKNFDVRQNAAPIFDKSQNLPRKIPSAELKQRRQLSLGDSPCLAELFQEWPDEIPLPFSGGANRDRNS